MMFRPRENHDQRILACDLNISPEPGLLRFMHDVFGNTVGVAGFDGFTKELVFDSRVRLDHDPQPAFAGVDGSLEVYTGVSPFAYSADDLPDLKLSMERHHADPQGIIDTWARRFVRPVGQTSLQTLLSDMTQAIHSDFKYAKRLAGGANDPLHTLTERSGSCRDFAVLMMEAVRSLGLAARFVSGYIYSPGAGRDHGRVGGGHTHAWVRVFLPACGWVEFDPTNGIVGNTDLVRVAISRDPRQATPLHGAYVGASSDYLGMDVTVDVITEGAGSTQPSPLQAVDLAG